MSKDGKPLSARLREARPATEAPLQRRLGLDAILASVVGGSRAPNEIGPYVIGQRLARGGMGVVYRARDSRSEASVALKILDRDTEALRARFEREWMVLRSLDHPRIVRYLDHGSTSDGSPYLVMEWLSGHDLAVRVAEGRLDVVDALRVAIGAAEGLLAAHAAGVVHRDVKPSNIFLVEGRLDDVRVIDFGIARDEAQIDGLTATGAIPGTPAYMAPEQVRGRHDRRSDVYALGATLFELLAGRPPFQGDSSAAVMLAVIAEAPPNLRTLRADIPADLDAFVARMLAKDPAARPSDMSAVIAELEDLAAGGSAAPAPGWLLSLEEAPRRARGPRRNAGRAHVRPGRTTTVVGRARELAILRGLVDEVREEDVATVVHVSGLQGSGKTTLLDELAVFASKDGARVLRARGTQDGAGSAFGGVASLLEDARAGAVNTGSRRSLVRFTKLVAPLLGRTSGRVASSTPDELRLAWSELVEAWASERMLVLIVDDAQWFDLASLRYVERAARVSSDLPILVAIGARSDAARLVTDPPASDRGTVRLDLAPLREGVAHRLAHRWGRKLPGDVRDRLVSEAAGNPGLLRGLIAASTEGRPPEHGFHAARTWERIDGLDAESRRVLRAAAIVGRNPPLDAIAAVLGTPPDSPSLATCRRRLGEARLLKDRAGPAATDELVFEDELTRIAAYELSTTSDRRSGHRAAARFFGARGRGAPAVVAEHLEAAGQSTEAAPYYLLAAQAAFAGDDIASAERFVAKGVACRPEPTTHGRLLIVRSEALFWAGELRSALDAARAAEVVVERRSVEWYRARAVVVSSAGQLGDHAVVQSSVEEAARPERLSPEARAARLVCVCRGVTQMHAGGASPSAAAERLCRAALREPGLEPEARGWAARVQASSALRRHRFDEAISAFVRALEAYAAASNPRSAAQLALYLGTVYVWTGAWSLAASSLNDAARVARRFDATYLETWATYGRAKLLVETADFDEARLALEAVIERTTDSPRMRAGAWIWLSIGALRAGHHRLAETAARRALETHATPAIRLPALAALARALVAQAPRSEEAFELARDLEAQEAARRGLDEFAELVLLAIVEVHLARSDEASASTIAREAVRTLRSRARSLASPTRQAEYLRAPHVHRRLMELGE